MLSFSILLFFGCNREPYENLPFCSKTKSAEELHFTSDLRYYVMAYKNVDSIPYRYKSTYYKVWSNGITSVADTTETLMGLGRSSDPTHALKFDPTKTQNVIYLENGVRTDSVVIGNYTTSWDYEDDCFGQVLSVENAEIVANSFTTDSIYFSSAKTGREIALYIRQ